MQKQVADRFIGRTHELHTFRNWLKDARAPRILYIHDATEEVDKKGGVGKTRLLQECAETARREWPHIDTVSIDFFNIAARDQITVASQIVVGLQKLYPGWSADAFARA